MGQGLSRFAFVVGLLCCIASALCAYECGDGKETEIYSADAVVFSGTARLIRQVHRYDLNMTETHVTFTVSQLWKGPSQQFITVVAYEGRAYPFKERQQYLVYAYYRHSQKDIYTDTCWPNKLLYNAGADLARLGPPVYAPKPLPYLLAVTGVILVLGVLYWRYKRTQ